MEKTLPYFGGFLLGGYLKSLFFGCPVTANIFVELHRKNTDSKEQPGDNQQPSEESSDQSTTVATVQPTSKIYRIYLTFVPEVIGALVIGGLFGSRLLTSFQLK